MKFRAELIAFVSANHLWDSLPHGRIISAVLAFTATALTATHAALKRDEHQAECRRLIHAFKSIRVQIPERREVEIAR
jgi:hypothetical protein